LTEFGWEKIEAWTQANNLNFSAAIETLALMGLDDERSFYAIPALRATTLQGIRLSFNRIARLLSDIAIEAAASHAISEGVMLQLIRALAVKHPDDFTAVMRVSRDGRDQLHGRARGCLPLTLVFTRTALFQSRCGMPTTTAGAAASGKTRASPSFPLRVGARPIPDPVSNGRGWRWWII
jgi:hypothetical protein